MAPSIWSTPFEHRIALDARHALAVTPAYAAQRRPVLRDGAPLTWVKKFGAL